MKRFRLPQRSLLILIAVLLFTFSFVPSPFWFLAYFYVPVFLAAVYRLSFRESFRSGYFFGLLISILLLYWVAWVTTAGFVALLIAHSLYYAVAAGLIGGCTLRLGKRGLILAPFILVAMEYLRSLSQVSFPWLNLSYTQANNLSVVQLSELSGDAVVSFFVLVVGTLLFAAYLQRGKRGSALVLMAAAVTFYLVGHLWGAGRIEVVVGDYQVAVLQGNVPIAEKWQQGRIGHNFRIYENLVEKAAADSAKFVVWPETAAPSYLRADPPYLKWVAEIAAENDVNQLVGTLDYEKEQSGERHAYNAALFFTPTGLDPRPYRKINLVPFSEHIPYEEELKFFDPFKRFLSSKFGLDISDFEPGDSVFLFQTDGRSFGTLICFEVVFPDFVRNVVNKGADFLTVITNDAWFGETAGPHQHAAIPIFRAVENRCWLIRAANTGISEIIDPMGRRIAHADLGERSYLVASIGGRLGETLFGRYGTLLSKISLAVTLLAALLIIFGRKHD